MQAGSLFFSPLTAVQSHFLPFLLSLNNLSSHWAQCHISGSPCCYKRLTRQVRVDGGGEYYLLGDDKGATAAAVQDPLTLSFCALHALHSLLENVS
jgi:hypothetical protein